MEDREFSKTEENKNDGQTKYINFKGVYYNNDEMEQYYEYGAHFRYKELCHLLEKLLPTLPPDRKGTSVYVDNSDSDTSPLVFDTTKILTKVNTSHNHIGSLSG
jgi:hypothetical protein